MLWYIAQLFVLRSSWRGNNIFMLSMHLYLSLYLYCPLCIIQICDISQAPQCPRETALFGIEILSGALATGDQSTALRAAPETLSTVTASQ